MPASAAVFEAGGYLLSSYITMHVSLTLRPSPPAANKAANQPYTAAKAGLADVFMCVCVVVCARVRRKRALLGFFHQVVRPKPNEVSPFNKRKIIILSFSSVRRCFCEALME